MNQGTLDGGSLGGWGKLTGKSELRRFCASGISWSKQNVNFCTSCLMPGFFLSVYAVCYDEYPLLCFCTACYGKRPSAIVLRMTWKV